MEIFSPQYFGAFAGLAASACWASASVLYARVPLGAGAMTTFKNALAAIFLFAALVVTAAYNGSPLFQATVAEWRDIGISGIVGLCFADIAYFRSIQILGPRRGLTLTLLTPPTTALLGQWWLNDRLPWIGWAWIFLTLAGVGIVMRDRAHRAPEQDIRPGTWQWGVVCALMGIATMAVGAVTLKRGTTNLGSVEATFIRLFSASVFGFLVSIIFRQMREIFGLFQNRKAVIDLSIATVVGTVAGVWLMLVAYKYCRTGIAATLTSTSPLFVIPVVWIFCGQRVTGIAILGGCIAFVGVCGLLLQS